jgi:integrase
MARAAHRLPDTRRTGGPLRRSCSDGVGPQGTEWQWQARWRDPGGHQRVKTFRLKAEAERFLVSIEDSMHRGAYHDPNAGRETLGAFGSEVRANAARTGRLSERTLVAYDEIWRLYLAPLGDHPLNAITKADIEDVIRGRTRAPDIHKVFRAILSRAVKAGKIAANPAVGVDVQKVEHREPRTLSGEELDRLVEALPDRYRTFVLVAAYSSLRWVVGARRAACRSARPRPRRIRVEEKIVESGRLIPGTPKTERSRRAVTLPHSVTLELAEHLRRYSSDGLVFTAERGGIIRRPVFCRLVWKPALERAALEGFRFGQLRHTGATLALEAGANPSWWRSGWVTRRRGCSSSTTPVDSIERTGSSRALWTLRHVCGTRRVHSRAGPSSTSPDLRVCL